MRWIGQKFEVNANIFQARVAVPDERWDWLVAHHKPASKVVLYDISICSQKSLIFVEFL